VTLSSVAIGSPALLIPDAAAWTGPRTGFNPETASVASKRAASAPSESGFGVSWVAESCS